MNCAGALRLRVVFVVVRMAILYQDRPEDKEACDSAVTAKTEASDIGRPVEQSFHVLVVALACG